MTYLVHYDLILRHAPDVAQEFVRRAAELSPECFCARALTDSPLVDCSERRHSPGVITFGSQEVTCAVRGHHVLEGFLLFGQRVFVVGPNVAEAFARTDTAEIQMADVGCLPDELPAPAFYLAFTDSTRYVTDSQAVKHILTGCYVASSSMDTLNGSRRRALEIYIWGRANSDSTHPTDDAVYGFTLPIETGKSVAATLQTHTDTQLDSTAHAELARYVLAVLCNLLMYLSSDQPDTRTEKRRQGKLSYRVKPRSSGGHTLVTYVGPTLERDIQASVAERDAQCGPCEHVVRPHWHHYWIGKRGQQKRVRRWVHAFTRGSGTPARRVVKFRETIAKDH